MVELATVLSVDEFLDKDLDERCELLGGETRPKPTGTMKHAKMQRRLVRLLELAFGEDRVESELSLKTGDEVLIPDLVLLQSVTPRLYRDRLDEAPLLCVEVVSPSQRPEEMLGKCQRYREFGVPFCWVIDPVRCRAWEFHLSMEQPREVAEVLTGPRQCSLDLQELFEGF